MARGIKTVETVKALRNAVSKWRAAGERVALVPTMGALHAGHLSLIDLGRKKCGRVIVSIFVNPAQFAANEDFDKYPRDTARDLLFLSGAAPDLVYAPALSEMYRPGFATRVSVEGMAAGLESDSRPHFFSGVATVVTKLLMQAAPDVAVFGEKDYQQLLVVKALVCDLDLPVEIVGAPTRREPDGLALSSRNAYLSPVDRRQAPLLYRTIKTVAEACVEGSRIQPAIAAGRKALAAGGFAVDYLEVRDAETLRPVGAMVERPARVLVAARLGKTRLIDNIAVLPRAKR